jgi:hypothetical protein
VASPSTSSAPSTILPTSLDLAIRWIAAIDERLSTDNQENEMPWQQPANYKPRDDLKHYLEGSAPKMNTPEMDMVIYWQWVHRSLAAFRKTPVEAWDELDMTPEHARQAIDRGIIPLEIYAEALARARL